MSVCTIQYTPVCGTGPDDPVCGLLELDGARLLLDCGWTPACDQGHLDAIIKVLPGVDGVVLTHGTLAHMGALPALVARGLLPPEVPIISTLPVKTLGALMLLEFITDKRTCSEFDAFNATHVTELTEQRTWALARFYQRLELGGRALGIAATPYAAGHTLGGAVWRLVAKGGQEVVYCTEWCHRKERHLAACQLPELFSRPSALLLGAKCALAPAIQSAERDAELLDVILSTVRGTDGCVLIPVDTTSRLLELALLLDEFWAREKFDRVYPLVLVSPVARAVAEAAQSMLEFMSDSVGKAFEMRRDNPFNFRSIKILNNVEQLSQLQAGPKVVLAGSSSLEHGAARQLLIDWAPNERNTICFVQQPQAGTLADTLVRHPFPADAPPLTLPLTQCRRVVLEGDELEAWLMGRQPAAAEEDQGSPGKVEKDVGEGQAGPARPGEAQVGEARAGGVLLPPKASAAGPATPFAGPAQGMLQSVVSGSHVLRSNSVQLSVLVRGPTGQLVQQLDQGQGAGQARALMDGCEPPQGCPHVMFPDEDDGVLQEQWDDYGIQIDHEKFKVAMLMPASAWGRSPSARLGAGGRGKGRPRDPGIKIEEDDQEVSAPREEDAGESEEEEEERPTKLVTEQLQLVVKAAIRYFNYDGLPDTRIFQKAITEVCPQALLVLRGAESERRELHAMAARDLQGFHTRCVTPGTGEVADVSVPACYLLYVSEALHRACPLHQLGRSGHMGVVVDAVVGPPDAHFPDLLQLLPRPITAPGGGMHRQPSGMLPGADGDHPMQDAMQGGPIQDSEAQGWLGDIFFADGSEGVRLSELKKALANAGIQSQLSHGTLSCGPVIISKAPVYSGGQAAAQREEGAWSGRGHLVVEAALSEQHDDLLQRVRSVIFAQFGVAP